MNNLLQKLVFVLTHCKSTFKGKMKGFLFTEYIEKAKANNPDFDNLFNIFKELITITGGDVAETLHWLTNLDKQYNLTNASYGIGDFIEDLKKKGFLSENAAEGKFEVNSKMGQFIRQSALEEIFGKLKKSKRGNHKSSFTGKGQDSGTDLKPFEYGDSINDIALTASINNAFINHGLDNFHLTENDLEVRESEYSTSTSTVLMIDISHSMILYGEDRITPAKKVAMALTELMAKKYPQDQLDILVFGNDAWPIEVKDLPYLQVGPYHTNTIAGLELAMDMLRKRKSANKQIFMITDGKPTCMKKGIKYYKNSFGLDPTIINKTTDLAIKCRKLNIPITTFMIASDPYLKSFVKDFTKANGGTAYYSSLQGLGEMVFEDYKNNKRKNFKKRL